MTALILFGALISCMVSLGSFRATSLDTSISPNMNSSILGQVTQLSLSSALAPVVSNIASNISQNPPTKSLSTNTEIASFLLDTYALGPDKSDNFLVPSFDPNSSDYLPTPHSHIGSIVNTRRYIITGEYLKIAQRKALRAWWKIIGVPQKSLLPKTSREENAAKTDETVYECF